MPFELRRRGIFGDCWMIAADSEVLSFWGDGTLINCDWGANMDRGGEVPQAANWKVNWKAVVQRGEAVVQAANWKAVVQHGCLMVYSVPSAFCLSAADWSWLHASPFSAV
jgi:hypothetical protein